MLYYMVCKPKFFLLSREDNQLKKQLKKQDFDSITLSRKAHFERKGNLL